ncbi:MAG TPA: hypothetical protein VLG69_01865 [Candidatus Andersenbacteria bacterium]|nr:hypothetical protein [Candidatus Andersenbacteria bacterium]
MENVQGDMGKHCEGCNCGGKKCNCPHHKAVPVCIILIALTFLLGTWGVLGESAVAVIWPVLLLIIGGTKLMASKCSCC